MVYNSLLLALGTASFKKYISGLSERKKRKGGREGGKEGREEGKEGGKMILWKALHKFSWMLQLHQLTVSRCYSKTLSYLSLPAIRRSIVHIK